MIQIRVGDTLNIREQDVSGKSKTVIKTFQVESIPKHKRFIACQLFADDKPTTIHQTFTQKELRKNLVWGGERK